MKPLEIIRQFEGTTFTNQDGETDEFVLLPPLTPEELKNLEEKIPCPLPEEIRELLNYTRGFDGILESIDFSGLWDIDLEEIFPSPISIAHDGFGNYWVVDLNTKSVNWGPIFFVCHDPPVIVYQTDNLDHFISEVIRMGNSPWESEIDDVHERYSNYIWKENPDTLSFDYCIKSDDVSLKSFAETLDESFIFIDLRKPETGKGFSWGRYGPKTINKRYGEERIFAYQRKTFFQRLFGK